MQYWLFVFAILSILFYGCSKIDTEVVQPTSPPPPPMLTPSKDQVAEVVLPDIPKTSWEPIFHEAIDERAKVAGIGKLREMQLADADIEVRIWGGFGLTGLVGFVLSRRSDGWSAISLHYDFATRGHEARTIRLNEPPAG